MSPAKIALLCVPVVLAGVGVAVHATIRVRAHERALAAAGAAVREAGDSFVETLQGEHAERQRLLFEERRSLALALAHARRDRMLGVLLAGAAALAAVGLRVLSRLAAEIEDDRRHVGDARREGGPGRS
jgi:hypothetical protein